MTNRSTLTHYAILFTAAVTGWFALVLQLYLILLNRTASLPETITRFFSFFTIENNILVALCCTVLLFGAGTKLKDWFSRQSVLAAITLYIAVVGIVYNTVLRFLWQPQGMQQLADELLHLVIPLLFVLYWIFFAPKDKLRYNDIYPWLIFPAVYCVYSLVRGAYVNNYPYPFIDVGLLGYGKVMLNAGLVLIVFLVLSLLMVWAAKLISRRAI